MEMSFSLVEIIQGFIDFISPRECLFCGGITDYLGERNLCQSCIQSIEFINQPICPLCGAPVKAYYQSHCKIENDICKKCSQEKFAFDMARSAAIYRPESALARAIICFKHSNLRSLLPFLSKLLFSAFEKFYSGEAIDLVIPTPLHWKRWIKRGYNQSSLLAKKLSAAYQIPLMEKALKRVINTQPQSGGLAERKLNVKDAFKVVNKSLFYNKDILLVDDVFTTGSTANEIAKELKSAGASKVFVLTIARAI